MTQKEQREEAIADAAYKLLAEKGYGATSMLAVAKAAKASNETLYRWYGDKNGLFRALIARNADLVRLPLEAALESDAPAIDALAEVAPVLLQMLTSDRAIVLNRAAAADPTGDLGQALTELGRGTVGPLLAQLIGRAMAQGALPEGAHGPATRRFVDLLVGDLQMRRAIGALPALPEAECASRADQAIADLKVILGRASLAP